MQCRHVVRLLVALALASTALACGGTAPAPVVAGSPAVATVAPEWAGTFTGTLQSGDSSVPATTVLEVRDGSEVLGRYTYQESTGPQEGAIGGCTASDPRTVRCTWGDAYGTGEVELVLAANGTSFEGRWRSGADTEWFPWAGTRTP